MIRISEALLLVLVNAAWQTALVAVLVSVSNRVLRRATARHRHLLWVAGVVTCVALALGSARQTSPATSVMVDQHAASPPSSAALHLAPAAGVAPLSRGRSRPQIAIPIIALRQPLALTIVALYGVLLVYRAGTLFQAWRRTRLLLRSARPVELTAEAAHALANCKRLLGLGPVSVLSSAAVAVPATAGVMQPVLILPEHLLTENNVHLLTSALGHEAAHIARRDYLMNLVYEFVSLPLWFHPAMRLLLRRVRQTRELCCDEIVTERLLEPRIYAQSLVQLAGAALPFGRPAATITVGMADADILEERIMSILKYSPARLRRRSALLLVAALLFVVPCIAAAPYTVHVAIHHPVVAAVSQNGAHGAAATQSTEEQKEGPQTIKLLTKDGDVTVSAVKRPKVGDVVTSGRRQWKIVSINPEGQYTAYIFKKNAESTYAGEASNPEAQYKTYVVKPGTKDVYVENKGFAYEVGQEQRSPAELRERAERAVGMTLEAQMSEQEVERVERAARAQRQAALARQAKITMDQAIQTALHDSPGTVTEAQLVGEQGAPTYIVMILQQNGRENTTARLLINAVDGSIITSDKWGQER